MLIVSYFKDENYMFFKSSKFNNINPYISFMILFVIFTYGLPLLFGNSWFPIPNELNANIGYDNFSFAYVDTPWRHVSREIIKNERIIPLWNPFSSLGLPFAAQYQNQIFSPFELIETFSTPFFLNIILLLKIIFAGLGTYYSAMKIFCNKQIIALGVSCFYILSSFLFGFFSISAFFSAAVLIPWNFLAFFSIFSNRISIFKKISFLSVTFGVLFLTGQPQISILTVLTISLSFLIIIGFLFVVQKKINYFELIFIFGCSLILACGIGLVQIVAFHEGVVQGYSIHTPGTYAKPGIPLFNLFLIFWPYVFASGTEGYWDGSLYLKLVNPEAFPFIIGGGILILSLLGTIFLFVEKIKKNMAIENIFVISFLTLISLIFTIIFADTLNNFSLWNFKYLNQINLPRYISPILSYMFSILSGFGLYKIHKIDKKVYIILLFFAVAISVSIFIFFVKNVSFLPHGHQNHQYMIYTLISAITPFFLSVSSILTLLFLKIYFKLPRNDSLIKAILVIVLAELSLYVRYRFNINLEVLRLLSMFFFCIASFFIIFEKKRASIIFVFIAIFIMVMLQFNNKNHMYTFRDYYDNKPVFIDFLQKKLGNFSQNGRVLSSENAISNLLMGYDIAEINSLNPIQINSTAQYIFKFLAPHEVSYTLPVAWRGMNINNEYALSWDDYFKNRVFYNMLSIRYLIDTTGQLEHYISKLKLIYDDGKFKIFEDPLSLKKAYTVNSIISVNSVEEAYKFMSSKDFDPYSMAVIETKDPIVIPKKQIFKDARSLPVSYISSNKIKIDINSDSEELVVLTDAYYPGWHVLVDGKEKEILRVNSLLRGVIVPAGTKEVIYVYKPKYLKYLPISLFLFLLGLSILFIEIFRKPTLKQ